MVDLKLAYLQIQVSESLWKFQVVKHKGVHYALTRLGFGLTCAPRIMTSILGKVFSLDSRFRQATHHYSDDIGMQDFVADDKTVLKHLAKYGLETKEPESR